MSYGARLSPYREPVPFAPLVHDVQNHLALIMACADRLAWRIPAGPARDEAGELHLCAERALAITRHILVAGRRTPTAQQPVDVNRLVSPALQTFLCGMGERLTLRLRFAASPRSFARRSPTCIESC